jgi:two-component system, NarL family, nitrate/nitrite response regulator NarL
MAGRIEVAFVTENTIMLEAVGAWLSQVDGPRLVAAEATVERLLGAQVLPPQVVLFDLCRCGGTLPSTELRLLTARYPVLALGTGHDPDATAAYSAGAHGYIRKEQNLADLLSAIRAVAADRRTSPTPGGPNRTEPMLSGREQAVLSAYTSGMTLQAVARRLGIKPETAKTYLQRVKAKYAAAGRPAYTKVDLAWRVWEETRGGNVPP